MHGPAERNGQPSDDEILRRVDALTKIKPVDDDRGHRWYPVIEDTTKQTRVQCRGVTMVLGYSYPTHRLQVQVYARLCRVMGVPITHTSILRLGSKHKRGYELASEEYDESAYETDFLACLHLWERAHPKHEGPYVEQFPAELSLAHLASLPEKHETNGKAHANGRVKTS